jgi:phosphoribosylglycinamide formyltransferase 1
MSASVLEATPPLFHHFRRPATLLGARTAGPGGHGTLSLRTHAIEGAWTVSGRSRLVVLVSGAGTNLQALLDACADECYGAQVVAVGADRDDIAALARAQAAGVPTFTHLLRDFAAREDWDRAFTEACAGFAPDLIVLAGFMKLVGAEFLGSFGGRVINTHPALLPSFPGMHGVRDSLEYGAKVTGCTVFLVDEGTDTGPVIAQAAVPVLDDDDEAALHERIKVAERALLVETVGRLVRDGWSVQGRKVRIGPWPR